MSEKTLQTSDEEHQPEESAPPSPTTKPVFYRSTTYNALVLGLCNFLAPGLWTAMNSLGGGGSESPYLVDAANALTFCLMVLSCLFGSAIVRLIGIKPTLILGTIGYAPYAAGLDTNNRFHSSWLLLLGAALCGLSAGIFWLAESSIALAYPEPSRQGFFLGLWLSFRVGGQILGGAINLGLNVDRATAGSVSYAVFLIFVALQACGALAGMLLTPPEKVQRSDGKTVHLRISQHGVWFELRRTVALLCTRNILLILPLIAQAIYTEAVMFTYLDLWFSVRARALGSVLSGCLALIAGNVLGYVLDGARGSLRSKARWVFGVIMALQGGVWLWATVITSFYRAKDQTALDWADEGFVRGWVLYLFWVALFQVNYMFLYFVVGNLARNKGEVVRLSALLRGTESAVQAVSYGLSSVGIMASVGGTYLNFGLWAVSLVPAWLVVRQIGTTLGDRKREREDDPLVEGGLGHLQML
ncbi:DUF895 domain membrane protein [Aspergillus homomorphus CBS 101889]|uniref:DUF895 domain membrane protein n=1 Tax=Aspergillus homomorphus (strain CBS 101889) TaxID=1450537 RepID=A0A395HN08_ASPHC|nr:DUF895 domain membrane protein [Aspergillus homomorphus CBS 101889]RAL08869.1 DUF895 domain membrane protein [Aspergillus homomorphus CBS 101889]